MSEAVEVRIRDERIPPLGRLVRVGLGLILLSLAASVLNDQSSKMSGVSLVWLSNGLMIGVLLCSPRKHWPTFLALSFAIDFGVNLVLSEPLGTPVNVTTISQVVTAVYLTICNTTEVLVAVTCMYRTVAPKPDLTQGRQLRSLLIYGVLLAPAVTSLMATLYLKLSDGTPFSQSLRFWFAADLLGIATTTPLYLSFHQGKGFTSRSKLEVAGLFILLCGVSLIVFRMTSYPMLWLVLLFLLLLGVRLGFTGSAAGLLLVTFIGGYLTVKGYGPLGAGTHQALVTRILIFQTFIGLSMFALYVTEVARSANRRVLVRLEASESRFRSMAEASRDVIVLGGLDGTPQYVSPAITELVGWEPRELVGINYKKITHPDDIPKVRESLKTMLAGEQTTPLAYRSLKKDGGYQWLEATTRLVRDEATGKPSGFVYVLRDITDRKAAELEMQSAYNTVERLAMMDGLTGVANRRLLDETLNREWLSGRRDRTPLSVLLIDVDLFKSYNDCYGHLAGDECLRRIASEIQAALRRPLDLLARYGGEEFVAVLPNTPERSAESIAERVRKIVEDCCMAHNENPAGVVTVSLGCATAVPGQTSDVSCLLKAADTALYLAKANGRNRKEVAPASFMMN